MEGMRKDMNEGKESSGGIVIASRDDAITVFG